METFPVPARPLGYRRNLNARFLRGCSPQEGECEKQILVRRLSAQPPEHPPQRLCALLPISVGSSHDECFAYPGDTLTFASCDRLDVSLQV